jgi:hypothetical protein
MEAPSGRVHTLTVEGFLRLSADINLQLQARHMSRPALLRLVLGRAEVKHPAPLLEALTYLRDGYGDRRRKNGPLAILHPLRTAALLSHTMENPTILDLLSALLHDKEEDLTAADLGLDEFNRVQKAFEAMRQKIDQDHQWFLGERMAILARRPGQSYYAYLGQIVGKARQMIDLLHTKLADRLDNTFDIAVQGRGVQERGFFETAFGSLFLPGYQLEAQELELPPDEDTCVLLLSQLFKNAVFMSVLRMEQLDNLDETTASLFTALADVSRAQAQWVAMETFHTFIHDPTARRQVLDETMKYCQSGGINSVTTRARGGSLDGTFLDRFAVADDHARKVQLAAVYRDHELLARLMVLFVAIFTCFLADRAYYIRGIDPNGLKAVG